ncbi:hypothetical protein DXG03_002748 [Asterophora parasitica]|uniref:Major facilitator superfamily (MFS) profile domain-containing protein n=1 Tax=Asterophora parasitica TaxID=117018 RepID=A0A9P7G440_9AGAR|nr:hypothetical protein DXG03_002748 [Asterophora parasitica]
MSSLLPAPSQNQAQASSPALPVIPKADHNPLHTSLDAEKGNTLDPENDNENDSHPKFDEMRAGKIVFILFSLGLASFLYAIEQTIVNTSISTIGAALETQGSLTWITTSYLLTGTVFQPVIGRLADAVGAKRLLIIEIWIFILGNIIAGVSKDLTQLVAGRLMSGVGGAGLLSLATIILSHLTNEKQRGPYLNLINLVFTVADAMGPIVGGGFSKSGNWRWMWVHLLARLLFSVTAYFHLFPVTVILIIALRTSKSSISSAASQKGATTLSKLAKLDFAGMATLIATLTFLVVALNLGGQSLPWGSPTIIGMFVAAAGSFALFVLAEKYAKSPVAPLGLFVQWRWRNVPLIIDILSPMCAPVPSAPLRSQTTRLPALLVQCRLIVHKTVFLQVIGVSAINAGALVIPFLSMAAISSTIVTYFSSRTGHIRVPFLFALAILPVGMGLMSTLNETASIGKVVGFSLICGFGFGSGAQISLVIAQVGLDTDDLSTITALVGSAPNLGGVLGIGIIGTIINNTFRSTYTHAVGERGVAGLNLNDVVGLITETNTTPGNVVDRAVVVDSFVHAWRTGARVLAGIAVAQFFLALLLSRVELDGGKGQEDSAQGKNALEEEKANHLGTESTSAEVHIAAHTR